MSVEFDSNVIVDERPWNKPMPNIDYDIKPFWDGLKEHRFLLHRCQLCGASYWPAAFCQKCPIDPKMGNMKWDDSSGRGNIFALNVVYWVFHPGFADEVPYAHAVIELDEGPLISGTMVQCDIDKLAVGQPVEVVYEDRPHDKFTIARFRPRSA